MAKSSGLASSTAAPTSSGLRRTPSASAVGATQSELPNSRIVSKVVCSGFITSSVPPSAKARTVPACSAGDTYS